MKWYMYLRSVQLSSGQYIFAIWADKEVYVPWINGVFSMKTWKTDPSKCFPDQIGNTSECNMLKLLFWLNILDVIDTANYLL